MWTYYEYGDNLIARRKPDSRGVFEVWNGSEWTPSYDFVRFSFTAQSIKNPQEFVKANPEYAKAFEVAATNERVEKAMNPPQV